MKRTAHGFLTAQRVMSIVSIITVAILSIIFLISGPIMMANGNFKGDEKAVAMASAGLGILVSGILYILIVLPICIISLLLNTFALRALNNARCKEEARKEAIMSIVSGALCGVFGIPAGIIMLTMQDVDYQK